MQGGSTGIGYGLKYQVKFKPFFSLKYTVFFTDCSICHLKLFLQARCIADVKADTDHTSFLAGTLSLKEENEVHLLLCLYLPRLILLWTFLFLGENVWIVVQCLNFIFDYFQVHLIRLSSDDNELICEGLFSHPDEIWDLASCPFDQRIFSTVFSSGK